MHNWHPSPTIAWEEVDQQKEVHRLPIINPSQVAYDEQEFDLSENQEAGHRLTRIWCAGFSGCQAMMTVLAHYCSKLKLPLPAINAEALLQVYCADLEIPMVSHLWLLPCTRCDFQGLHRLLLDGFQLWRIFNRKNPAYLAKAKCQWPDSASSAKPLSRSQGCVSGSCWGAGTGQSVW